MKSSGLKSSAENKKDPLEKAFLGTMKTINERCQSLDKKNTEEEIKKNDEETLFCLNVTCTAKFGSFVFFTIIKYTLSKNYHKNFKSIRALVQEI